MPPGVGCKTRGHSASDFFSFRSTFLHRKKNGRENINFQWKEVQDAHQVVSSRVGTKAEHLGLLGWVFSVFLESPAYVNGEQLGG